ncbi:MAG: hypothetical protein JST01_10570 [Cyanobacteria bacterium SZAS TMP-1]|nr:hypothetical protein [Cyanobacteria bacterium SZAS TMP-1]
MTMSENEDKQKREEAEKRAQARAERLRWMNNPEAAHSLSDVAPEGRGSEQNKAAAAFLLTEGDNVIASKTTARAEAEAKSTGAATAQLSTDELLSQWSGQKQKQKARRSSVQEELLQRVRAEIDLEIDEIREQGYPLGSELILIARAFGKDPRQWLPSDKVSNLFIEAVLYSAGLDLPWGFDSIPDYAELKYVLSEDKRFVRVFRHDKGRVNESAAEFAACPIEDGDIALWASPDVQRSGFIERAEGGRHNILSAGCEDSPTGFIYTTLEFFINTYATKSPTPDVVYRLTRL